MSPRDDAKPASDIPSSDSTLGGLHGIDSRYMKRAVLYARVSTDAQQKEGALDMRGDRRATEASVLEALTRSPKAT